MELGIDVDLNEAQAVRGLENLEQVLKSLDGSVNRLSSNIKSNEDALNRQGNASNRAGNNFNNLGNKARGAGAELRAFNRDLNALNGVLGAIAAGAAVQQVASLADTWTFARNKIAAAGVETGEVDARLSSLADTAIETRSELSATVGLFSRMKLAADELGESEARIGRLVEITNKALAAGGATAAERSSAVTQLTQGLGSGNLAGDELKAIRENSSILSKAIAEEFGVTVGQLKKLGSEGKLESKRVFEAIIAAGVSVDAQYAKTTSTSSEALTNFKTNLTEYIGGVDASTGATAAFVSAMEGVGENLDVIGDTAAATAFVLGGVLAGQAMVAVVRGAVAMNLAFAISGTRMNAMTVSAGALQVAMVGVRGAMAFLGGPLGIALTAAAVGVALLTKRNMEAAKSAEELRARVKAKTDALDEAEKAAKDSRVATGDLSAEEYKALEATAKLTNNVDLLTSAYGRMTLQAYAAARAAAAASLAEASADRATDQRAFEQRRRISNDGEDMVSTPYGSSRQIGSNRNRNNARANQSQEAKNLNDSVRAENAARAEVGRVERDARSGDLSSYEPARGTSTPSSPKDTKGSGGSGASDAQRATEQRISTLNELRDATKEVGMAERDLAALEALGRAGLERSLVTQDQYSVGIRDAAYELFDLTKATEDNITAKTRAIDVEAELLALTRELVAVDNPAAARTQDINAQYSAQEKVIRSLKITEEAQEALLVKERERRDIALQIEGAYAARAVKEADLSLDRQEQDLGIKRQALSDPEGAERAAQLLNLERGREDAIAGIDQSIDRQGAEYARLTARIDQLNQEETELLKASFQIEDMMEAYDGLTDFFTDLFDDPKKALQEYTQLFLKNLIKMIAQAYILKAVMGDASSGGGAGGGGGGTDFGALFKRAAMATFGGGRAVGGSLDPKKLTLVGEHGPELIRGVSGHVIPAGKTKAALAAGSARAAVTIAPVTTNTIHFSGSREEAASFSKQLAADQRREMQAMIDHAINQERKFS